MKYAWKILGITAQGDLITSAKYHAQISDSGLTVETEGTWFFKDPKLSVPFADVTEEMVIAWIIEQTKDGDKSVIEARLSEQLETLKKQQKVTMPWMPQTFTPKL